MSLGPLVSKSGQGIDVMASITKITNILRTTITVSKNI